MSEFLKPQSPLQHKDGAYIYPLTTADQVILEDNGRLNAALENLVYVNDESQESAVVPLNADTLGGHPVEDFIKRDENFETPKAGFIYPLAGAVVPEGFLLCDGAAYSRTEYQELFAAIGTIYGSGDGSTTFNVPNLQTRVPVGAGDGYELGDIGGEAEHTLTIDEMPSHHHTGVRPYPANKEGTGSTGTSTNSGDTSYRTNNTGGSQPHNNMQPYTVVNYIIATGKDTGVSVSDVVLGAQAIPLGVEYGGTGATNAETARENLEITPENIGALSMELLWENASPTSEFAAQSLSIEDSDSYFYAIEFNGSAATDTANYLITFVTRGVRTRLIYDCFSAGGYNNSRPVSQTISNDNVIFDFGVAYSRAKPSENGAQANTTCIPIRIYGIKGVSA